MSHQDFGIASTPTSQTMNLQDRTNFLPQHGPLPNLLRRNASLTVLPIRYLLDIHHPTLLDVRPSATSHQLRHLLTRAACSRWTGGAFFGRVIDTYGTHHVAIPCSIAIIFFMSMLSLCTSYARIFLTQGVGFGLAASGLFSCGIVSVGQWFHKRKALALGIVLGEVVQVYPSSGFVDSDR